MGWRQSGNASGNEVLPLEGSAMSLEQLEHGCVHFLRSVWGNLGAWQTPDLGNSYLFTAQEGENLRDGSHEEQHIPNPGQRKDGRQLEQSQGKMQRKRCENSKNKLIFPLDTSRLMGILTPRGIIWALYNKYGTFPTWFSLWENPT